MSNSLLKITTSVNGDHSISNGLADAFVAAWKEKNPDGVVIERDLQKSPVPHVDGEAIYAGYTPEDQRSPSQVAKFSARLELVNEIKGVTEIVIATPMWNWQAPSVLKAYIDAIIIPGVLAPGQDALADKKFTFLISQGGSYAPGSGKEGWDYLSGYLVMVAKALGATDVQSIVSEFGLAGIAPGMESLVSAKEASIAAATEKAIARASE